MKRCKISGCLGAGEITKKGTLYFSKGYCKKHYARLYRNGTQTPKQVHGNHRLKHPLYFVYMNMKARCLTKTNPEHKNYGGRGIKICKRWLGIYGFDNWLKDMGERPKGKYQNGRSKYSIDRIDNSGHYEPSNCRWANLSQQNKNRRRAKPPQTHYNFAEMN